MNPLTSTPAGDRPENPDRPETLAGPETPAGPETLAGAEARDRLEDPDEEKLPSFAEQVADQLGGVRGLIESSLPVTVFVIVNLIWDLKPAIYVAVAFAVLVAVFRFSRKQPIRHAINGIFGIALGAWLALRSGEARDFYLPGIFISLGYAVAMLISVALRQPIVGWIWSVVMARGSSHWRTQPRLLKTFGWLTILWAAIYLIKVAVQGALYAANLEHALGVARVVMGFPPYAMLLLLTMWAVRRVTRDQQPVTQA